jgi:hypothetical protein
MRRGTERSGQLWQLARSEQQPEQSEHDEEVVTLQKGCHEEAPLSDGYLP